MDQQKQFETQALRVANVCVATNFGLSVLKFIVGLIAHSHALVSDAVNSASDVLSNFIVILGVKLSSKEADSDHPYGHERLEPVTAVVLSVIFCVTGIFVGHTAVERLRTGSAGAATVPGTEALIAAVCCIAVKEILYRYTKRFAVKLDSSTLMAQAWDHRSDELATLGTLIGTAGTILGYWWMDSAASLVICCLILKSAVEIFVEAMGKLVDRALDEKTQEEILACVGRQEGVLGVAQLMTRKFGNRAYVDVDICADGNMTLFQSDALAEQVHEALEQDFPQIKHISVRTVPFFGQE